MKLSDVVASLARPSGADGLFAARKLEAYGDVRLGVDAAGAPGLFFEMRAAGGPRRSFVLASVSYAPDARCRFDGDGVERRCAVLRCTDADTTVRDLFLRVVEAWLPTAPKTGVGVDVDDAVARLIDLFEALTRPGQGEVLGLWGELFVIHAADEPRELLRAWRCDPFELHDFVATAVRLEVKTAVGFRRHQISLEQLRPPAGDRLIVASIVTKPSARGMSVDDLYRSIVAVVDDDSLAFRIEQTIALTLGRRWHETTSQRYDARLAAETLSFFDGGAIPSVDPRLPPEVSHVRFSVELDSVSPLATCSFLGVGARLGLHRHTAASAAPSE
ncbi:MAG: PD-(D/E)XK motif protein [Planctomycetes bacterium]|nr:PD-(D/E)XK motif protein [Planctomycetota bacterium]